MTRLLLLAYTSAAWLTRRRGAYGPPSGHPDTGYELPVGELADWVALTSPAHLALEATR